MGNKAKTAKTGFELPSALSYLSDASLGRGVE